MGTFTLWGGIGYLWPRVSVDVPTGRVRDGAAQIWTDSHLFHSLALCTGNVSNCPDPLLSHLATRGNLSVPTELGQCSVSLQEGQVALWVPILYPFQECVSPRWAGTEVTTGSGFSKESC
jgi:hypothetical protein